MLAARSPWGAITVSAKPTRVPVRPRGRLELEVHAEAIDPAAAGHGGIRVATEPLRDKKQRIGMVRIEVIYRAGATDHHGSGRAAA